MRFNKIKKITKLDFNNIEEIIYCEDSIKELQINIIRK